MSRRNSHEANAIRRAARVDLWEPLTPVPLPSMPDDARAIWSEAYANNLYGVTVVRIDGHVYQITITPHDGTRGHIWADFQRIKDQIAGPDVEAVELYPAQSRLVDAGPGYHLWCLRPAEEYP